MLSSFECFFQFTKLRLKRDLLYQEMNMKSFWFFVPLLCLAFQIVPMDLPPIRSLEGVAPFAGKIVIYTASSLTFDKLAMREVTEEEIEKIQYAIINKEAILGIDDPFERQKIFR